MNLSGFMSDRFLSPPSPRSIHNTGRGLRSFAQLDFRATDSEYFKVVMIGDGVNFELPKDERDEVLRPDLNNVQRTRSQSLIVSWDHIHSTSTLVRTAFYQRWSSVHQFPETIDVSIGWNVTANGSRPRLSLQFNVENLSNKVHLLSKEHHGAGPVLDAARVLGISEGRVLMSRVIILGATGTLGRHVLRQAIAAGYAVTVFVRTPSKLPPDLRDRTSLHAGDLSTHVPVDLIRGQDA